MQPCYFTCLLLVKYLALFLHPGCQHQVDNVFVFFYRLLQIIISWLGGMCVGTSVCSVHTARDPQNLPFPSQGPQFTQILCSLVVKDSSSAIAKATVLTKILKVRCLAWEWDCYYEVTPQAITASPGGLRGVTCCCSKVSWEKQNTKRY